MLDKKTATNKEHKRKFRKKPPSKNELRAVEVLDNSEQLLRSTLDALHEHIVVLDAKGTILSVNKAWQHFAAENGADPGSVGVAANYFQVCEAATGMKGEDAQAIIKELRAILEGKQETFSYEYPCHSPDEERWFVLTANIFDREAPLRIIIVHKDITERKLAEEEISNIGHILEQSLNEIYIFDKTTLRFIKVNRGARDNLGYSREEMEEKTPIDINPLFTKKIFDQVTAPLRSGEKEVVQFNTVHERKDKSRYPVEVYLQLSSLGKRPVFVAIILDTTERVQQEEELRIRDQAISKSTTALVFADIDGTITFANHAFVEMWGFKSEKEVVGVNNTGLGTSPDRIKEIMHAVRTAGHWSGEDTAKKKDGSPFDVYLSANLITDDAGVPLCTLATFIDITEQKKVQNELEKTAYELRWAQQIVHLGSFTFDIKTPENDSWSEEMYRIRGHSLREKPVPHTVCFNSDVHEEDRERVTQAFVSSVGKILPFDVQHRIVRPNGAVRHVHCRAEPIINERGEVTKLVGTLLDITDQKRIENEIRQAQQQTQAILDTTVDGIITIGKRGNILSFNLAAEQIFGYGVEEVVGQNVKMLMPAPYHEEHDGYLQNYIETGHRKIIGIGREVIGRRKDGSIFPMELSVSEIQMGKHRLFTGLVRDITERRKMELEILQISEFERQNIGQELHDGLGSQLTGIGMICQLLAKKLDKAGSPVAADVADIAEQIREADYLTRNIARGLVPVAPEPSGLRLALQRLSENAERIYGVSCAFKEAGDVLIEDAAVSMHLYRIAQEAFTNGIKHGKATKITINLKVEDENNRLILEVVDNGEGMPDQLPANRGVGLRTMMYRANVIGGQLNVGQGKKGGTIVSCTVNR